MPQSDTPPFRVAPLESADRPRWEQLWAEYQAFYRVSLPEAVTQATWARLHNGRIHGFGARNGAGVLVGIVHYLYHEDTWSVAIACYLQDLYVDASTRGRGCARLLIEAVASASATAGANPPYWLTHETNATARRLYDQLATNAGFLHYQYSR